MKIFFINPNLDSSPIPNIGLAYVMSSIERYHKVKLLDMGFHARRFEKYILDSLKQDKPDVIGFSVTSFSFHHALKIASLIRSQYPDIPLVYGGVHPTLLPEETLQNPLVDAICVGEGEDSFKEYLDKLQNNQEPKDVQGIWYKDKSNNIIRNPLRPFREDLDSLPFPNWDHWEIDRYLETNLYFVGAIGYMFSRGCPYSCTFCSNPAIRNAIPGKFYRLRSPENVIEEVKRNKQKYYDIGFRHIIFCDEIFSLSSKNLEAFLNLYTKENLNKLFTWHCQTRPDVIDDRWARKAKESGCIMVSLGVESGDENIRMNVYNKKFTNRQIYKAIEHLEKCEINYAINIILGSPEDSYNTINKSFNLLRNTKPITETFHFYQPLPKTELLNFIDKKLVEEKIAKMFNNGALPVSNAIVINTRFLKVRDLRIIKLAMRLNKVYRFVIDGLKLKGLFFIKDTMSYFYKYFKDPPALNSCFFFDLTSRTVIRYKIENQRRESKLKNDQKVELIRR